MLKRIVKMLAKMPVPVHYFLSDYLLYPTVYHLLRYRIDVVTKNLQNSFPHMSSQEISDIRKKFYHHLCDVVVESIYGYGLDEKQMLEHVEICNLDAEVAILKQHGGGIAMLSHSGNWEWLLTAAKHMHKMDAELAGVYKRLKNKAIDELVLDMRKHYGALMMEKQRVLREIIAKRNSEIPIAFGLLSDQTPTRQNAHLWTTFLNQDTPWVTGSDTLARKYDMPVFYASMHKVERGKYVLGLKLITEYPCQEEELAITRRYTQMLEADIMSQPELWLWTHKRWKLSRNEANKI